MSETRSEEIHRESVSLRDYLQHVIAAGDKLLCARIDKLEALSTQNVEMVKEARDKYELAQRAREVVSNEFRASLEDQAKNLVSVVLFNSVVKDLGGRIDTIDTQSETRLSTAIKTLGEKIEADRERLTALEKNNVAVNAGMQQKAKGADTSFQWIGVVIALIGVAAGLFIATRPVTPTFVERAPTTQGTVSP